MFKTKLAASAAMVTFVLCAPAFAADEGEAGKGGFINEIRMGLYDHNTDLMGSRHETSKPDVNLEVLFNGPSWLQWMAEPRIHLGTNLNTGSGTSSAYTGLVWDFNLTDSLFIEGSFGAAIHDGKTDRETPNNLDLGCRVLFHENASIGYRITPNTSVMVSVDHMSSAALCNPNPGLTDVGVRLGYSF
ncbi:MAG: acyloxyacyl hydrolase [Parvibaculum sp.]|nr:acyloxyacyl hydrolase [Parvibaculum sp.]